MNIEYDWLATNFYEPKSKHANKIWLSIGLCLRIGHFNICDKKNYGKLLETS
jgi:hypothetical protein